MLPEEYSAAKFCSIRTGDKLFQAARKLLITSRKSLDPNALLLRTITHADEASDVIRNPQLPCRKLDINREDEPSASDDERLSSNSLEASVRRTVASASTNFE